MRDKFDTTFSRSIYSKRYSQKLRFLLGNAFCMGTVELDFGYIRGIRKLDRSTLRG